MLEVMATCDTHPKFECFDIDIVRSVAIYLKTNLFSDVPKLNFVINVANNMPYDAELLTLLPRVSPLTSAASALPTVEPPPAWRGYAAP